MFGRSIDKMACYEIKEKINPKIGWLYADGYNDDVWAKFEDSGGI